jgi:LysM repeat protein
MTENKNDKRSINEVISAYRKRQARGERLMPVVWIVVMLLVVGGGYLIYRLTMPPGEAPLALKTAGTPTPAETVAQNTPTATTPAPTASETPGQTEMPLASAEPAAAGVISYTVQQGDTLVGIASQFGVGLPTLSALNPLVTPEYLNVGDQLSVPAPAGAPASPTSAAPGSQRIVEYQVKAGDTLAAIAANFGSTIDAIVQENNLESPDQIFVGQTLRIPIAAGGSPAATPIPSSATPTVTATLES